MQERVVVGIIAKASESHNVILKILPFLFFSSDGERCVLDG